MLARQIRKSPVDTLPGVDVLGDGHEHVGPASEVDENDHGRPEGGPGEPEKSHGHLDGTTGCPLVVFSCPPEVGPFLPLDGIPEGLEVPSEDAFD